MQLFTLIVLLLFATVISTCYLNEISPKLALAAQSAKNHNVKCVYDIVHEYLPDLSCYYRYYDLMLIPFIIPFITNIGNYSARSLFGDLIWLIGPVILFRCHTICVSVSTATTYDIKREFGGLLKRLMTGSDQDLCFSGHTAMATCLVLILFRYKLIRRRGVWLSGLFAFGLFATMSRSHFTTDIVWAFVASAWMYDQVFKESGSGKLLFS